MAELNYVIFQRIEISEEQMVDLTHELSAETPHWYGFKPDRPDKMFDKSLPRGDSWIQAPMRVSQYSLPVNNGTH
jgi:kynurenine formamidase